MKLLELSSYKEDRELSLNSKSKHLNKYYLGKNVHWKYTSFLPVHPQCFLWQNTISVDYFRSTANQP